MKTINDGVWPTMVTPFTDELKIDYKAVEKLTKWYVENGADGIFAVCQSSEMFYLSLDERVELAKTVVKNADNTQVIASGHISDDIHEQIIEISEIAKTGIVAVVLVTNRLAKEGESEKVLKENLVYLIKHLPEKISLGFYECPYPYKRMLSDELLKWCADTGRFLFYKDTSCNSEIIRKRIESVKGTGLKIFNANSATLLDTLKLGVNGYSGVMANFHPGLYKELINNWRNGGKKIKNLSSYLSLASCIESRNYPKCAKYALQQMRIIDNIACRKISEKLIEATKNEVNHLLNLDLYVKEKLQM